MKNILLVLVLIGSFVSLPILSFADEEVNTKPSFSGVLWATYWHAVSGAANNVGNGTANSFDIKRAYLNVSGDLDHAWSWRVIFEMGGTPTLNAFAKAAFIKWKVPGSFSQSFTFGLQPTLTWATSESYWGYRVVMMAPREALGATVVSSSGGMGLSTGTVVDFGITYTVKPMPIVLLSTMIGNGSGHKAPETNMYKKLGMSVAVTPAPNSIVELYFESEGGYSYLDNNGTTQIKSRVGLGIFAGYKVDLFGFGIDYFQKSFPEKTIYDTDGSKLEVVSSVLAFFGNYAVTPKLRLLGRYDLYTPLTEAKFIAGTFEKSSESLLVLGTDCSYGPPNTNFILSFQQKSFDTKFNNGSSWVDRDPYNLVVMDVILKF